MELDINQPIVWTTKGNVQANRLTTEPVWTDNDDITQVVFVYRLEGEVVREDKYIKIKKGMSFDGVQGG